jgi:acyl-homoserine lactone synthase
MIRVIDKTNFHLFPRTMDQLFRVRHSVFVEEKGWIQFERDGIYEKDQYDTEDATYVVALDNLGTAIGCFRLYPTVLPHMLSEQFPHLVLGEVLRKTEVLELTRFHLGKTKRQSSPYLELLTAIPEIGLELKLSGFTALVRTLRIPVMLAAGLLITPTGLPVLIDGESHMSVLFEVSEKCLARINKTRGSTLSVFEHNQAGHARADVANVVESISDLSIPYPRNR